MKFVEKLSSGIVVLLFDVEKVEDSERQILEEIMKGFMDIGRGEIEVVEGRDALFLSGLLYNFNKIGYIRPRVETLSPLDKRILESFTEKFKKILRSKEAMAEKSKEFSRLLFELSNCVKSNLTEYSLSQYSDLLLLLQSEVPLKFLSDVRKFYSKIKEGAMKLYEDNASNVIMNRELKGNLILMFDLKPKVKSRESEILSFIFEDQDSGMEKLREYVKGAGSCLDKLDKLKGVIDFYSKIMKEFASSHGELQLRDLSSVLNSIFWNKLESKENIIIPLVSGLVLKNALENEIDKDTIIQIYSRLTNNLDKSFTELRDMLERNFVISSEICPSNEKFKTHVIEPVSFSVRFATGYDLAALKELEGSLHKFTDSIVNQISRIEEELRNNYELLIKLSNVHKRIGEVNDEFTGEFQNYLKFVCDSKTIDLAEINYLEKAIEEIENIRRSYESELNLIKNLSSNLTLKLKRLLGE